MDPDPLTGLNGTSSPVGTPRVVRGTHEDAAEILRWLKAVFDVDHDGFWHNRNIVERAVDAEELWVIREDDRAVAFLVGNYAPDIINVRQDRQRRGLGEALFAAALARAEVANVVVLNITCMPPTSLPFWRRMGFEPIGPIPEWQEVPARRILGRTFALPADLPRVTVEIGFYPERAVHVDGVEPFELQTVSGAVATRGEIAVERRVIGLSPDAGDLVVKLVVDDKVLCFDKAKYPGPEALGFWRTPDGAFVIDVVEPATTSGDD